MRYNDKNVHMSSVRPPLGTPARPLVDERLEVVVDEEVFRLRDRLIVEGFHCQESLIQEWIEHVRPRRAVGVRLLHLHGRGNGLLRGGTKRVIHLVSLALPCDALSLPVGRPDPVSPHSLLFFPRREHLAV